MPEMYKEMVIKQGYVPSICELDGRVVWALINKSIDPCDGCAIDRNECDGRRAVSSEKWAEAARLHIDAENRILFPHLFPHLFR